VSGNNREKEVGTMKQEDSKQYELMIGGSGGQGVLLIGRLLAEAALSVYQNTLFFPNYGAQMRAGPSECTVIFSNEEISSPALLNPEVGIALDQVYLGKLGKRIRPDGVFITESTFKDIPFERNDVRTYYLPATEKAVEYESLQSANLVFLGAYLGLTKAVPLEVMEEAISKKFMGGRGEALIPVNNALLREGASLINSLQG